MKIKVSVRQTNGVLRFIGTYDDEENLFTTHRKHSVHFMFKYNGWGIDKETLLKLQAKKSKITIIDDEEGCTYKTDADTFMQHGIEASFWDYLPQVFLNVSFFEKV